MASDDKKKALDAAIAKLEKDFGKGTVMKLGDPAAQVSVETIPTGSLSLDIALGLGGVPRGRVVEIYGPESSGKTTLALHCVAEAQKAGGQLHQRRFPAAGRSQKGNKFPFFYRKGKILDNGRVLFITLFYMTQFNDIIFCSHLCTSQANLPLL